MSYRDTILEDLEDRVGALIALKSYAIAIDAGGFYVDDGLGIYRDVGPFRLTIFYSPQSNEWLMDIWEEESDSSDPIAEWSELNPKTVREALTRLLALRHC